MKAIGQFLLALTLSITMAGQALALDGKLFVNSTAEARWAETLKLWEKDGILEGENINLEKLYPIVKGIAIEDKHPAAELSDQAFAVEMAKRNGLPASGMVKAEALRFMAQGNGIYLPTPAAVAAARAGTSPAPTPAPAQPVVATSDSKQAVALANLEAQVKSLKDALAKSGASEKELTAVSNRLAVLGKQIGVLQSVQAGFVQKAQLANLEKELAILRGEATKLGALVSDVEGLKANYNGLSERLSAIEQKPAIVWDYKLYTALGLLALIAWVAFVTLWRRGSKVKVVAEAAKVTAEEAKEGVELVRKQAVLLNIVIPENLELQLRMLQPGEIHRSDIMVDGESKTLVFSKVDNGQVKVDGIKGQHNPVRTDKIVSRIKRAASLDDLVGANDTSLKAA